METESIANFFVALNTALSKLPSNVIIDVELSYNSDKHILMLHKDVKFNKLTIKENKSKEIIL